MIGSLGTCKTSIKLQSHSSLVILKHDIFINIIALGLYEILTASEHMKGVISPYQIALGKAFDIQLF